MFSCAFYEQLDYTALLHFLQLKYLRGFVEKSLANLWPLRYYVQNNMNIPHETEDSAVSLKKFEAFVKTAQLGSLTKAAEALGSTQSRISHILSDLETEYGFSLMHRSR